MSYIVPGSVILITGATGGIGIEIASQAAAAGAVVGIHGRRPDRVAEAIANLRERHPEATFIGVPGDFREEAVIDAVITQIIAKAGRLDALIHCATSGAAGVSGLFAQADPKQFGPAAQAMLGIFQQLCFAALPHLARQGGTIIGFVSDAGRFAAPHQSVIGAAFGGIIAFVRNLSLEIARDKVRIHVLSPSYVVDTPVFEMRAMKGRTETAAKRAGLGLPSPRDIAPMTLFLCSPAAEKITGQIISINGGLSA